MPFYRWKNGPWKREDIGKQGPLSFHSWSLELWTHITDAQNHVNIAKNRT